MADRIRICPRCGGSRMKEVKTSISGWLVPSNYYCEDCKYSGPIYVEVDADEAEVLRRMITEDHET